MKRLTTFLPSLLALIAIAGITIGLILPTFRRIQDTRAATIAEYEQFERRYERGRQRSRAALELAEREQVLESLIRRIPNEDAVLTVVRSIEAIAATHQLEERIAIDWSTVRTDTRIVAVPTTIELSGSYPNLLAALRDLERMALPFAVEQLDIASGASPRFGPSAPRARVQLILRTSTLWKTKDA